MLPSRPGILAEAKSTRIKTVSIVFFLNLFFPNIGVTSKEQKVTRNEQKITNSKQKVTSNEQKLTSKEQKVTSNEKKLTSNEEKVTSNEQKVTSKEQQAKRSASKGMSQIYWKKSTLSKHLLILNEKLFLLPLILNEKFTSESLILTYVRECFFHRSFLL